MGSSAVKEKLKVYEALLSVPGMSESVKVSFTMSRKDILLLSRVIEVGLNVGSTDSDSMVSLVSEESKEGIKTVMGDILKRAELSEFNEKLKLL